MSALEAVEAIRRSPQAPADIVVGVAYANHTDLAAYGFEVGEHTPFDVASVTKVLGTVGALHRLASLGEISFDDTLERWLPDTNCAAGTTLRTLLTHRAGLWEWQPFYTVEQPPLDVAAQLPLRYAPNTASHYSDLSFMFLGRVVEKVTSSDLASAVTALVFEPLALSATTYGPRTGAAVSAPNERVEEAMIATQEPYPVILKVAWRLGTVRGEVLDGNCHRVFMGVAGHAGLFSTANDLLRYASAAAAAAYTDSIWRPETSMDVYSDGPDSGQALGWRSATVETSSGPSRMLWHPGFTGCAVGFLPERGIALTLLSNRLTADMPLPTEILWARALHHTLEDITNP